MNRPEILKAIAALKKKLGDEPIDHARTYEVPYGDFVYHITGELFDKISLLMECMITSWHNQEYDRFTMYMITLDSIDLSSVTRKKGEENE